MKTFFLLLACMIILMPPPADAHALKRNCLWSGNNIFRVHVLCRDGDASPRATPSRSVAPSPPHRPDCKDDDDKEHGKGKGHDRD